MSQSPSHCCPCQFGMDTQSITKEALCIEYSLPPIITYEAVEIKPFESFSGISIAGSASVLGLRSLCL